MLSSPRTPARQGHLRTLSNHQMYAEMTSVHVRGAKHATDKTVSRAAIPDAGRRDEICLARTTSGDAQSNLATCIGR
jgi:hypothetical protein